jgi:hypothetical protein
MKHMKDDFEHKLVNILISLSIQANISIGFEGRGAICGGCS